MNCNRVVAERLLRESFRIAGFLRPLRPRIPIGMKRDSRDLDAPAGSLEQACPVLLVHCSKPWEQGTGRSQTAQYLRESDTEVNNLRGAGFGAKEAHHLGLPINVFCPKACHIALGFFFSSRRRHTRYWRDWSSDVCSSDLPRTAARRRRARAGRAGR